MFLGILPGAAVAAVTPAPAPAQPPGNRAQQAQQAPAPAPANAPDQAAVPGVIAAPRNPRSARRVLVPTLAAAAPVPSSGTAPVGQELQASLAAALQAPETDEALFPHYPQLKVAVEFWTHVFADWSENQSVLHSTDDLGKIYTVLDFREQATTLGPMALAVLKSHEEAKAREDFSDLLQQVSRLQATPQDMNPEQRRIFDMFAGNRDPQRFKDAIDDLRIQRGLRERTEHALTVAGRYLPQMEETFASYDLPRLLTRLPLMESSFNIEAYSKAGAAGVWQFIPSSARIYMRLNDVVDDRRDPWFSTDAAARHLKDDYDALRDWPLALTAYNYGRGGLARALAEINGTTLLDVIDRFDNARFGFASRNYYAEFLAAADVERNWRVHFRDLTRDKPVPFELVETRDYLRYDTVRKLCAVDPDTFRSLNPAFRDEVVDGKLYVPPSQPIRVPAGAAERFRAAYAALDDHERFDRQRQLFASYRVRRGDSPHRLARRFGISVHTLLAVNDLGSKARFRVGETLRIPAGGYSPDTTVLAQAESPHGAAHSVKVAVHFSASRHAVRTHRVESGQTLGGIAKRYQVSLQVLRKFNRLRNNNLRAGTMLKIP